MSPDHHLSESVYRSLKADLLDGTFGVGRLNLASLVERYNSSATPVREALLRLVGESLVELLRGGGFGVAAIDSTGVRQLYDFNRRVIGLIKTWRGRTLTIDLPGNDGEGENSASKVANLFLAIVSAVANPDFTLLICGLNDRLWRMRVAEAGVIEDAAADYAVLVGLARRGEKLSLVAALDAYHQKRMRYAHQIAQACYPVSSP